MPPKEDNSIYNEYFKITKEYQEKYGKNTVLLMQVGSFFEIYGLKNVVTNDIGEESEIITVANHCQFNVSEKKAVYNNHQILMAGFPDYRLEKYLQKITECGFTAVVYVQERNEKNTKRIFHSVHSVGTFVSYDSDNSPQITNNIMCIWMETYKPYTIQSTAKNIVFGLSVINILTGQSSIFEYQTPFLMNPTTFDELERFICMYSPSEVIIISEFDKQLLNTIIQYSGIKASILHNINVKDTTKKSIQNCSNKNYIRQIISTFFNEETYEICKEFDSNEIATQSYCYLLNFIQEHNPNLIRKISLPIFTNTSNRMILANHTLKQLNIIDDSSNDGKRSGNLSSVLSFLNKCCSSMGKRRFQYQLLNPTFNEEWLNKEYNMIEIMRSENNYNTIQSIRKVLLQIKDIEKMCRQLILQKIFPSSIYNLYKSIQNIQQINILLYEQKEIKDYLSDNYVQLEQDCKDVLKYIESNLIIEKCKGIHSIQTFEQNIIHTGISDKLDNFMKSQEDSLLLFNNIREKLNKLLQDSENTPDIEYVKEHETEKSGSSLQITKKRGLLLKKILHSIACSPNPFLQISDKVSISANEFKLSTASSSNDEIECSLINKLSKDLLSLKDKINKEISNVYNDFIIRLEKEWFLVLENIANYISKLDVLQSKVYVSKEYNYCKPLIDTSPKKSFVEAKSIRHCLIEHIQQNEIYVPNDITLGKNEDGILLYGTNAVGKTSIIRALGISIILAQSGMYVPCSSFTFKPYTCIFSRILGNDNIFKGMSTFAVEMSELRIILKMSNENSLILGDELCSGTETESALSIFIAGLKELHNKESSFIFATHFHEIVNYDEIKSMDRLVMKHLSVYYDRELDCLVYDRKLKEGSGTRMYGLEVCKSLHLPDEFLENAYAIRNKYFPETVGELNNNKSVYNSKKIKSVCEICKECMGEDIHHLQEQKYANDDGYIDNFHKNHKANLINICKKCHDKEHAKETSEQKKVVKRVRKTKTTKGYELL